MVLNNVKLIELFSQDAWQYKNRPNFKMMWYEDMKRDLITVIRDLTRFLGYHLTELKILTLVRLIATTFKI